MSSTAAYPLSNQTVFGFYTNYFSQAKGIETVGKILDVGFTLVKIVNPALTAVADSFAGAGKTIQQVCKITALPAALKELVFLPYGTFEATAKKLIHSASDISSKVKGLIAFAGAQGFTLVSKVALKRLNIFADAALLASCTINGQENVNDLLANESLTAQQRRQRIAALTVNITLVAVAAIGLASSFALITMPVWGVPSLLALYLAASLVDSYIKDGMKQNDLALKTAHEKEIARLAVLYQAAQSTKPVA